MVRRGRVIEFARAATVVVNVLITIFKSQTRPQPLHSVELNLCQGAGDIAGWIIDTRRW